MQVFSFIIFVVKQKPSYPIDKMASVPVKITGNSIHNNQTNNFYSRLV